MNICMPGACICDAREWPGDTNCMGEIWCDECNGEHVPGPCPPCKICLEEECRGGCI